MRGQDMKDGGLSKRRLFELLRCGIRKRVSERFEDCEVKVMSKNMIKGANLKQLEAITSAMSGTLDGFGAAGGNEWAKPQKAEWHDLAQAIDWLLSYEWGDDIETGQSYINAAEFLAGEALKKLKKNYAKTNGLKVSQVKFKKAEEIVNG
jgi:hypothetical protein